MTDIGEVTLGVEDKHMQVCANVTGQAVIVSGAGIVLGADGVRSALSNSLFHVHIERDS